MLFSLYKIRNFDEKTKTGRTIFLEKTSLNSGIITDRSVFMIKKYHSFLSKSIRTEVDP